MKFFPLICQKITMYVHGNPNERRKKYFFALTDFVVISLRTSLFTFLRSLFPSLSNYYRQRLVNIFVKRTKNCHLHGNEWRICGTRPAGRGPATVYENRSSPAQYEANESSGKRAHVPWEMMKGSAAGLFIDPVSMGTGVLARRFHLASDGRPADGPNSLLRIMDTLAICVCII